MKILFDGVDQVLEVAEQTMTEVRKVMFLDYR